MSGSVLGALEITNLILQSQGITFNPQDDGGDLLSDLGMIDPITNFITSAINNEVPLNPFNPLGDLAMRRAAAKAAKAAAEAEIVRLYWQEQKNIRNYLADMRIQQGVENAAAIKMLQEEERQTKLGFNRQKGIQSENILSKPVLKQIYSVTPKPKPITQLTNPTNDNTKLLSMQARSREMRDDALARSSQSAIQKLEIEAQQKLYGEKRSILSSESAAIKNLINIQKGQLSDIEKQKKEAEQIVIQNEIQQRLKNIIPTVSTRALPPSVRALPPSVRGRGNKLLVKVMNDFGMTKLEAQRYIKKYGVE